MENGAAQVSNAEGRDPSGFLSEIINSNVTVKLNSGVVYKGMFSPFNLPILSRYHSRVAVAARGALLEEGANVRLDRLDACS